MVAAVGVGPFPGEVGDGGVAVLHGVDRVLDLGFGEGAPDQDDVVGIVLNQQNGCAAPGHPLPPLEKVRSRIYYRHPAAPPRPPARPFAPRPFARLPGRCPGRGMPPPGLAPPTLGRSRPDAPAPLPCPSPP